MESLANLESFVRSAELGSFSAAARRLGLTPAGVSRNVAALERNLGVRLFHRSTRSLTLTEEGERFLGSVRGNLEALQHAIAAASSKDGAPAGTLRVSIAPAFGIEYILPRLPEFLARYPHIKADWSFENRQVDLVAEGYDVAIGGGFELTADMVARSLAPVHAVAVASPAYMEGRIAPRNPEELSEMNGIVMRSDFTGRVRHVMMRDAAGREASARLRESIVLNDPAAIRAAALAGLGVTLLSKPDVLTALDSGALVRLAPAWYADMGPISIYYANRTLLPAKTRVFVDFVAEVFARENWPERFAGSLG
ncbi:LysR substrate-binding domain-containing protein [Acuticoccus sp. M5D2P5]|uniref:LysR family transcriptional regulator n=1 Tax=Acuticoccus kalidii TaxID=2910977 RepID=UPI001F44DA0E|nr:LysR family transcriptional regulator [Acuticoccus kalidii]MCF3934973.1 LysR substrate-binding domain-containing protein [Acuticoccus kalidii]